MKVFIAACVAAFWIGFIGLCSGCAFRMTVTPITAEEIVQKSATNQFFDWLFNKEEEKK